MSYTYLLANKDITIRKYDKETETSEEKVLTVDELKKEFRSWQTKNKAKENTSKSEKQGQEISSPVYEEPDKDYEPIDI